MSLDVFIQEIEKRKKDEINFLDNMLAENKAKVQKTKETTIRELQDSYIQESKIRSHREATRIVEAARLKAKKILFDRINENMDSTFNLIRQQIKNYVGKPQYVTTLQKMIAYAEKELGSPVIIHCRKEDGSILSKKKSTVIIGSAIDTIGGILAEDKSGQRELDLTFEELLRNHEGEIKNLLLERMMKQ